MFMIFKKKKIIFYTVMFLLVISGYFTFRSSNIALTTDEISGNIEVNQNNDELLPGEAVAVSVQNDFCMETKLDRETIRSKSTEILRSIINSDNSSEESKKEAENMIIKIANDMEKEMKIENLLHAKGFENCVAFITDDKITLTIKSENKLSENEIIKINDIIHEITGNNNTKIVEVN